MRKLSDQLKAQLATLVGTQPILMIGLGSHNNNSFHYYSEKDGQGMQGRIVSIANIESVTGITDNTTSANVQVVLSDHDGVLKDIFDAEDLHKVPANIYQYYEGANDKFLLLAGRVSSPVVWSEGDRTLSFDIVSAVEDTEVGFSPEEGKYDVAPSAIGNPWPLCFGLVVNVPGVKVTEQVVGQTTTTIGLPDPSLEAKYRVLTNQMSFLQGAVNYYLGQQVAATAEGGIASQIEPLYVQVMGQQDGIIRNMFITMQSIEDTRKALATAQDPIIRRSLINSINNLIHELEILSRQGYALQIEKASLHMKIQACAQASGQVKTILRELKKVFDHMRTVADSLSTCEQQIAQQYSYSFERINIINGSKFPETTEEIIINGMLFKGVFDGDDFVTDGQAYPRYTGINLADRQDDRLDVFWISDNTLQLKGQYALTDSGHIIKITEQYQNMCVFELKENTVTNQEIPTTYQIPKSQTLGTRIQDDLASVNAFYPDNMEFQDLLTIQNIEEEQMTNINEISVVAANAANALHSKYVVVAQQFSSLVAVAPVPLKSWITGMKDEDIIALPDMSFFKIDPGAEVRQSGNFEDWYVANIIPSTIKVVSAKKAVNGRLQMVQLPESYYAYTTKSFGGYSVTGVKTVMPLSQRNEGWQDQIYITLKSTVGPNTVDILIWMIQTYTDLVYDAESFNQVKGYLSKYPMNFMMKERKNILSVLKEIAEQNRCALWIGGDNKVYIKYLPVEADPVKTISEAQILKKSLQITYTDTENLVTKYTATWQSDYSIDTQNKYILRYNIPKYKVQEESYNYYAFSHESCVRKSAIFWMIRKSNTWKVLKFQTALDMLELEPFDTVEFQFTNGDWAFSGIVKGEVRVANYNAADNVIDFEVWVPVRAGEMAKYDYAWPAGLSGGVIYPAPGDTAAGGTGPGPDTGGTFGNYGSSSVTPLDNGNGAVGDSADGVPADLTNTFVPFGGTPFFGNNLNITSLPAFVFSFLSQLPFNPFYREVMIGVVMDQVDPAADPKLYNVVLQNGIQTQAYQYYTPNNDVVPKGTVTPIVLGNYPGQLFMQAPLKEPSTIKRMTITAIKEDHLECVDVDGNTVIVAKPYALRRTSFDDIQVDNYLYKWVDSNVRNVTAGANGENPSSGELLYSDQLSEYYRVDGIIYAATILDPKITLKTTGESTSWLDINADGKTWIPTEWTWCIAKAKDDYKYDEQNDITTFEVVTQNIIGPYNQDMIDNNLKILTIQNKFKLAGKKDDLLMIFRGKDARKPNEVFYIAIPKGGYRWVMGDLQSRLDSGQSAMINVIGGYKTTGEEKVWDALLKAGGSLPAYTKVMAIEDANNKFWVFAARCS